MANNRIQPQYIRLNGKAIANVTGSSTDLNANDALDFEIKTIVAITVDDTISITNILLNKEPCEIQGTLGDSVLVVTCRCVTFSGSSEAESGKYEGTFKFENSGNIQLV
jgi:hypothetical protein